MDSTYIHTFPPSLIHVHMYTYARSSYSRVLEFQSCRMHTCVGGGLFGEKGYQELSDGSDYFRSSVGVCWFLGC